jgi:cobalt-zinc-cadmium resistance protein CzcA
MFERLVRFVIEQRWLVMLAVAAMAALGMFNALRLPIDAVPDITNVQVQVNTAAPGYSPLEAEQRITVPVETAMAGLPGLEQTRSLSRYGLSQVTVIFRDGTDLHFARQLVSQRMQDARAALPDGVAPTMGPIATGLGEIYMWTVEAEPGALRPDGKPYAPTDLREIQDWVIKPQLRTVPGVTEINTIGGYAKEYVVAPNLERLSSVGLSLGELVTALERNNVNVGAGYIERGGEQYLVRAPGQVRTIADIGEVVLGASDGVPIRIRDVAEVDIGKELRTGAATSDGGEAVLGTVFMLIGENSRAVSHAVDRRIAAINGSLPPGVKAVTVYDRTTLVEKTIATVRKNLLEGAVLVIAVLFVFLGNLRAAIIAALVIPLSMLFTFTGMVTWKVSANLMSLGALDFGIIIDGAVVIVESCVRRLSQAQARLGRPLTRAERFDAVFAASKESRRALVFGQLIIMVVYLPIFALTGVEGKMFHPMALTVVMALLGAMILSITFVPAAVALGIGARVSEKESRVMTWARRRYAPALDAALRNTTVIAVFAGVVVLFSLAVGTRLGTEFIPNLDEGDIALHAMRIPGTSLTQSVAMQAALETRILTVPEVRRVFSKIGTAEIATDPMPPNVADTFVMLKPQDQWPAPRRTRAEVLAAVQAVVATVPGNNYEFTQPIQMRFNELLSGVRSDVAVKVFGDEMDKLDAAAAGIAAALRNVRGAESVKVEQTTGLPMLSIEVDRRKVARYGIALADVQETIATAIGGKEAGLLFEGDRRFGILVRLPETVRQDIEALKRLPVPLPKESAAGRRGTQYVPLSELATFEMAPGPNQVSRENGKRRVVVSANVRGRDIGSFVADAQRMLADRVSIPSGYWVTWGGRIAARHRDTGGAWLGIRAAVHHVRQCARRLVGVHRHSVRADGWHPGAVVARYSVVDSGRGGLRCLVGGGCAERAGDAVAGAHLARRRHGAGPERARGRRHAAAARADDSAGRLARLPAHGHGHGHRCRGAAAAGHRGDRRGAVVDGADAVPAAGVVSMGASAR